MLIPQCGALLATHQKTGNIRVRGHALETVIRRVVARLAINTKHAGRKLKKVGYATTDGGDSLRRCSVRRPRRPLDPSLHKQEANGKSPPNGGPFHISTG